MPAKKSTSQIISKPLKWAGGKGWLVPRLQELWEPHKHCRLVEPFVGGMSVALGLMPEKALLNDANPHLINFYRQVQSHGLTIDIPMENDRDFYLRQRNRFNYLISTEMDDCAESAQLFYYLNRTGFNGLTRFNNKGFFNVPFGAHKTINYATNFLSLKDVLAKWETTNLEYNNVQTTPNDLIYADPPYDTPFTKYTKKDFKWEDQLNLVEWLSTQEKVIASNQATDRIKDLYKSCGFNVDIIIAPRSISCNGDRTPAEEILAWKGL